MNYKPVKEQLNKLYSTLRFAGFYLKQQNLNDSEDRDTIIKYLNELKNKVVKYENTIYYEIRKIESKR